ncbi:AVAST type 4 anti-phage nuclease Avs4 [Aliarcobacter butzleri]|uniref:AVAST type 4 anti-phage nuclease Avs4 n=1 Tax=Aliarcobacter butzleri TaxID=28197 RepID=UPI001ED9EFBF|nr:AVAST type 4 anti-phage nuclease Avs4 [Aliarcobacter butzleri]MCG3654664.1 hypothetical protein [Aliarcobacter butzleri]
MIKPNWDIFKAKFSENPQYNFEWFCYLLFCKQFNKEFGIFRYINQAGIETDPINVDNNIIGWQSKFYETSLSENKEEILSTIEKSKKYYPNITKLYFYTNQEWGQNKGKKPKGLIEVENKAKQLNITLEWRTASFFESEFVVNNNKIFAKHFFTQEKSIFNLLENQKQHTENILNEIHTKIIFNEENIEIQRDNCIDELKKQAKKVSILTGVGGVGKTVIIKKLYEYFNGEIPFLVFKATEFELRHINDLFKDFSFYDFAEAVKEKQNKIIVIDSAERLLDLKNTNPFKEFLLILIEDKWQIIFTTRTHYLENLYTDLSEIYAITPLNINIDILNKEQLEEISEKYSFSLPKDEKLLTLIKNPFYLNTYLNNYTDTNELNYNDFKTKLWNKKIKDSKPERERCFLKIAFERANSGQFFISPTCESNILHELVKDGILGYEDTEYFITHDIYEEWALEKKIEIEFKKRENELDFFKKIGQSLPIRRSFRNWLSEKLLLQDENIKGFIEEVFVNEEVEQFWKDELIVSILLSDYSKVFFELFKEELLEDKQKLLKRITFILRMTCKDIDNDFFLQLGIKNLDIFSLKYVLTKPKGQGWENLINFVFENLEIIGIKNINFILPIIYDWNSKIYNGKTTKLSSLIALKFYEWTINDDVYLSRDDNKKELFQTIINGSSEIKDELIHIFDEILGNKWKNHREPYNELIEFILTKFEANNIIKNYSEYILKIADLFWTYTIKNDDSYYSSSIEVEQYFGLGDNCSHYFPASAYQTPIYFLLKDNFKGTIDFILEFTNKSVEKYANSDFDYSVKKVNVYLYENIIQEQYISHCLWNMYRGTSSPISPYLLQSIHMALEKYLLEIGKLIESNVLEYWLLYLLKNSKSASISSVVSSIVLAYPDKTFNIAQILFKTKDFILQDTNRLISDQGAESLYSIGKNWGVNTNNIIYDEERISTCKDEHRSSTLENLFLKYQFFRNEEVSEEEADKRQKKLWSILDTYYNELPKDDNPCTKTWRLYLARMDIRKMNLTTEKTSGGILINFNPELESDLKEYSEKSIAKTTESMKYTSLKLWADFKFRKDDKAKNYEKYETNPLEALKDVKDIVEKLNQLYSDSSIEDEDNFILFNKSIPLFVCSLLIRDYIEILNDEEKDFCKSLILKITIYSLSPDYQYQISDGIQQAFSILPILYDTFLEEKETIKFILLIGLFKTGHVGGMFEHESFNIFSIMAINNLWEKHFFDAQSLLFGYLLLKPKYDELILKIRKENYEKGIYNYENNILEKLYEENEEVFKTIIENRIDYNSLSFDELDFFSLKTAFSLIPIKNHNKDHKNIVLSIIKRFINTIFSEDRDDKIDYTIRHKFYEKYVYFVLNLNQNEIKEYLEPFVDKFNSSEHTADLLKEFVIAEDYSNTYDNFWFIWNIFKDKIFEISKKGDRYWHTDKILRSYLFAEVQWKDTAKDWHSFKNTNKKFFKEISENIGHCPSTLYAISKLLNNIGTPYLEDGITWLSIILKDKEYINKKLEMDTIYYIEQCIKKYIYINREKIKTTNILKNKVLTILNFLIEKGSIVGYMLRENII